MIWLRNIGAWMITALITITVTLLVVIPAGLLRGDWAMGFSSYYATCILTFGYLFYASMVGVPLYLLFWHRDIKLWNGWIIPLGFLLGVVPILLLSLILTIGEGEMPDINFQMSIMGGVFGLLTGVTAWLMRKLRAHRRLKA